MLSQGFVTIDRLVIQESRRISRENGCVASVDGISELEGKNGDGVFMVLSGMSRLSCSWGGHMDRPLNREDPMSEGADR